MKQEDKQFDIFISYRRDGGVETARLIYDRLTNASYRVSFDMETLRSGKFNTQLYERINHCKDVIVLLSNKALELRENPSDDWFRLEVAHALKHQKNIIPVFLRDFTWPDKKTLPEDIMDLYDYEGVSASDEHFDSTFRKLCNLLKSKPSHKKFISFLIVLMFLILVVGGMTVYAYKDKIFSYPFTNTQRKNFDELVYVMAGQGTNANQLFILCRQLLDAAEIAVTSNSRSHFLNEYSDFLNRLGNMDIEQWKPSEKLLEKCQNMPVEPVDVKATYDCLQFCYKELKKKVKALNDFMSNNSSMPKSELLQCIQITKKYRTLLKETYSYYFMSVFKDISLKKMEKSQREIMNEWTELPLSSGKWEQDEKMLEDLMKRNVNKISMNLSEYRTLVGNIGGDANRVGMEYTQLLNEMGVTSNKAENMLEEEKQVVALQRLVDQANKQADEKMRKTFAPLEADEPNVLWAKAMSFLSLNMPEDALNVIDILRKRKDETFSLPICDAMMIFIRQRDKLPFKCGVMVCMFEPPATSHAIYKPGDIVTWINEKPCINYDSYKSLTGDHAKVQFWRLENGCLVSHEEIMPESQPRAIILEIPEKMD